MAHSINDLQPMGQGNPTLPEIYTGATADDIATVEGAGYFDASATRLKVNDVILLAMSDGCKFYRITDITDGVVTAGTAAAFA